MKTCTNCGAYMNDTENFCPKCGTKAGASQTVNNYYTAPAVAQPVQKQTSGLAKFAKVMGILSFFFGGTTFCWLGFITALCSKADTKDQLCSDAKTGLICSIISFVLKVVLPLIIALIFWGALMRLIPEIVDTIEHAM